MEFVKIRVDFGYAYDFLSIYDIKSNIDDNEKNNENYERTWRDIKDQIGSEKHQEIMSSQEYSDLYDINGKLFDLVDAVKKNPCLGKELDDCVYKRWLAKKTLQQKFFPEIPYNEQKIGYDEKK